MTTTGQHSGNRWRKELQTSCTFSQKSIGAFLLVFLVMVAAATASAQTFSVLYNFGSVGGDPMNPTLEGVIAEGRDGALYSTSQNGNNNPGIGPMFRITISGVLTEPYNFDSTTGQSLGGLSLGTDGNFYGTTYGGAGGSGIVFRLTPTGTLTTLHTFSGSDGSDPFAPPIQATDGSLYGTAVQGGAGSCGTVYKLTLSGTFTLLYQFDQAHGCFPSAPLVQGTDGNFYGTTYSGGTNNFGVVFKITPAEKLIVLFKFDGTNHGATPFSPLIQATDGNFYGTTLSGGKFLDGAVFRITPAGKVTLLHSMNGTTDGYSPEAGLVQATDGKFYGVAPSGGTSTNCTGGCGTIFRVTPAGVFDVIYNFDSTTGNGPEVTVFQHTNGILYGDTVDGGTGGTLTGCTPGNCGVFYSLDIGAAPFVSLVSATAKVGKTVGIVGQGFTGTTGVSFDGIAASFKVASDTYLTATVPTGAKTGPVTVTTPGGTLNSGKTFRVTPQLLSFSPPSGPVGTSVVITGVSLTQTAKVTFGGVSATSFTVNSDTQVTATVPSGAKTGKIVITTQGGTASSATNFTVT